MFNVAIVSALLLIIISSAVFFVGWGIPAIKAYRKGVFRVGALTLIDFLGFNVMAMLLAVLALYNVYKTGIQAPTNLSVAIARFGQTGLIAALCTIRCVAWLIEHRKHRNPLKYPDIGASDERPQPADAP